jgi:hypothetical protein
VIGDGSNVFVFINKKKLPHINNDVFLYLRRRVSPALFFFIAQNLPIVYDNKQRRHPSLLFVICW